MPGYAPKYRFVELGSPAQYTEQSNQTLRIEGWSANVELRNFQALASPPVQGEPRISSPSYGSTYYLPPEATDDDGTNSSQGYSWALSPATSCEAAYSNTGRVDPVRCEGRALRESHEALSTRLYSLKYRSFSFFELRKGTLHPPRISTFHNGIVMLQHAYLPYSGI